MENKREKSNGKSVGRTPKAEKEKLSERITLRFTKDEMKGFNDRVKITYNLSKVTDLLRNIILKRKIIVYTKNKDLEDLVSEIAKLRSEMNAIGVNFNQIAKRVNTYDDHFIIKKEFPEIQKTFDKFIEIQKELGLKFDLVADEWLRK